MNDNESKNYRDCVVATVIHNIILIIAVAIIVIVGCYLYPSVKWLWALLVVPFGHLNLKIKDDNKKEKNGVGK